MLISEADAIATKGFIAGADYETDAIATLGLNSPDEEETISTIVYPVFVQEIYDLINETGKTVTIDAQPYESYKAGGRRRGRGRNEPNIEKVTPPYPYSNQMIATNTNLLWGDTQCYLSALGINYDIEPGIEVTIDGVKWITIAVGKINDKEDLLLFNLQLRASGNMEIIPSSLFTEIDLDMRDTIYELIEEEGQEVIFVVNSVEYTRKIISEGRQQSRFDKDTHTFRGEEVIHLAFRDLPFSMRPGIDVKMHSKTFLVEKIAPVYTGEQVGMFKALLVD